MKERKIGMIKNWSKSWLASVQPRKQRKYRLNAPSHVRQSFLSVHLSPELRKRYSRRSMRVRKGDEVKVLRGSLRKKLGTVDRVDVGKSRVYVEELKTKKSDGSEVHMPLQPSNIMITKLKLDDKKRQAILERSEKSPPKRGEQTESPPKRGEQKESPPKRGERKTEKPPAQKAEESAAPAQKAEESAAPAQKAELKEKK